MSIGLPVVGLATTEMATVVENGVSGWVHTDVDYLIGRMKMLLENPVAAMRMGEAGRKKALGHFSIDRFVNDWEDLLYKVSSERMVVSQPP